MRHLKCNQLNLNTKSLDSLSQCSVSRQVHGIQFLHLSRFSAFLFMSPYELTTRSSNIPFLGLPLPLFPSILPSITSLSDPSPLRMCPTQFFFLFLIKFIKCLSSSTLCKTSSFVTLSVQLIFSILLHNHISNASSLLISSFLSVQVSAPYNNVVHINVFTIFFLHSIVFTTFLLNRFVNNSFLLLNVSLASAI